MAVRYRLGAGRTGVLVALRAFSTTAIFAAGAVGLTGVTNAVFELRHVYRDFDQPVEIRPPA